MTRQIRGCSTAVIGGAGFLGSHLVNHLIEDRSCGVLVVDNLVAGQRAFVHPGACFEHADISHGEELLKRLFAHYKVKYVFNYAAWPYVPDSFARPKQVFEVNAIGAINVINAVMDAGCEGVLQVSSAEVYGDGGELHRRKNSTPNGFEMVVDGKISESAPVSPHSTYGLAKAAADAYVQCAWKERGARAIALRQFNCVGERETHPYVITEIISQLWWQTGLVKQDGTVIPRAEVPTVHLGNNSLRDFIYAGDAVRLAVELLERGKWGEVYNLGSESGIRIYALAKLVGKEMGFTDVLVEEEESRKRPWEIWHLQSDNTKLRKAIFDAVATDTFGGGWMLESLTEAIRRTIAWFKKNKCKWPWER